MKVKQVKALLLTSRQVPEGGATISRSIQICAAWSNPESVVKNQRRWAFPQAHNSLLCSSEVCLQKAKEKTTAEHALDYSRHSVLPLATQEVNKSPRSGTSLPSAPVRSWSEIGVGCKAQIRCVCVNTDTEISSTCSRSFRSVRALMFSGHLRVIYMASKMASDTPSAI